MVLPTDLGCSAPLPDQIKPLGECCQALDRYGFCYMKWGMGSGKTFGGLYTALSVYEKCVVMVTLSSISTQYFNEVCKFMASSKIPVYLLTSKNDKFFKGVNVISINTLDGMLRVDNPWIEKIVTTDTVKYIRENFKNLFRA
jgi:hypothetical protein